MSSPPITPASIFAPPAPVLEQATAVAFVKEEPHEMVLDDVLLDPALYVRPGNAMAVFTLLPDFTVQASRGLPDAASAAARAAMHEQFRPRVASSRSARPARRDRPFSSSTITPDCYLSALHNLLPVMSVCRSTTHCRSCCPCTDLALSASAIAPFCRVSNSACQQHHLAADSASPTSSDLLIKQVDSANRRFASPRPSSSLSSEAGGASETGAPTSSAGAYSPEKTLAVASLSAISSSDVHFQCRQCPTTLFPTAPARDNHKRPTHVPLVHDPRPGRSESVPLSSTSLDCLLPWLISCVFSSLAVLAYRVDRSDGTFTCPTCERTMADAAIFAAHLKSTKSWSVVDHWPIPTGVPANWTLPVGSSTSSSGVAGVSGAAPAAAVVSDVQASSGTSGQTRFGCGPSNAGPASLDSSDAGNSPLAASPSTLTFEGQLLLSRPRSTASSSTSRSLFGALPTSD